MQEKLGPLRGMKDLFGDKFEVHRHIEDTAFLVAKLYGFEKCATPILENIKVFNRTLGETSDVISKEIYSFEDRKGRLIALRPEFTAGIMRAYISNRFENNLPLKLFSSGPLFRYDRPQEGRQRQFHQVNFEYIGAQGACCDAEIIAMAAQIIKNLNLSDYVTLELNSLGCDESRGNYQKALVEYFSKYKDDLSEDSQNRLISNPMRVLDSKDFNDQDIVMNAPEIGSYYTKESREYFDNVQKYLNNLGVDFSINKRLVRGLDYYCHTAFEFTTDLLGAQSTVLGGGRYDGLAKLMGGDDTPAIGFAAGIERIASMQDFVVQQYTRVYILPINEKCFEYSMMVADKLRSDNIPTEISFHGKVSKRLQNALKKSVNHVIFLGEEELNSRKCRIKNIRTEEEYSVNFDDLISSFIDGF